MLKRMSTGARTEDNYEHVLMCLICRSLFDDYDHQPKFLPCHHTFCKDCLREYVRQFGDEIECPSCRKVANIPTAGVTALQTNFYVKYIQSLVCGHGSGASTSVQQCSRHETEKLHYFCRGCELSICKQCCGQGQCGDHEKIALTQATEESHQSLDTAFSAANSTIESKKVRLDKTLKALADEKDQALLNIDSTFDQHTHTVQRRATLLKNKVIAIYNEHKDKLENDLEEIGTALTCIVSIKDYHEEMISQGHFRDIPKGLEELEEVNRNIGERIHPVENHIVFETNHGVDRFKGSLRDLGRVRCSRPIAPRADPEGNAGEEESSSQTPDTTPCVESKVFSSPEVTSPLDALQSPPEGSSYTPYPPDVTAHVSTTTSNQVTEQSLQPEQGATGPSENTPTQPNHDRDSLQTTNSNQQQRGSKSNVPPSQPDLAVNASPKRTAASQQDVKPKGGKATTATASKQQQGTNASTGSFDANRNCQQQQQSHHGNSDVSKPNPIAKLDLGRFARGPGKTTPASESSKKRSDRQNGNLPPAAGTGGVGGTPPVGSKIPTKPSGIPSPTTDSHRQIPGQGKNTAQTKGAPSPPSKIAKHAPKLEKIRAAYAGSRHRSAGGTTSSGGKSPGATPSGGSIIAQAIASTSQDRQASGGGNKAAGMATRPDTLLKPGTGHLPVGGAAPAMPDLLPESVLKVMQSGTDDEKLRAEKEYYHLLYTSYDEEELLRELKSGAAPAPSVDGLSGGAGEGAAPVAPWSRAGPGQTGPRASLEDSDNNSWLTTSSASDGSNNEESEDNDVLVAPTQQQTTV